MTNFICTSFCFHLLEGSGLLTSNPVEIISILQQDGTYQLPLLSRLKIYDKTLRMSTSENPTKTNSDK